MCFVSSLQLHFVLNATSLTLNCAFYDLFEVIERCLSSYLYQCTKLSMRAVDLEQCCAVHCMNIVIEENVNFI